MDNIKRCKELVYGQKTNDDVENIIYKTNDYSKFSKMPGNREVRDKSMQDIELSMNTVGQIANPVIVNEFYQICEGQHRFDIWVVKQLPIYYCVIPGLRLEHCMALNTCGGKWTNDDRINSFATENTDYYIEDFARLQNLYKMYPKISKRAVAVATHLKIGYTEREIKSGTLVLTKTQYENAIKTLDNVSKVTTWYNSLAPVVKANKGSKATMEIVIAYICSEFPEYFDRLFKQLQVFYTSAKFGIWADVKSCFDILSLMYNDHLADKNKINFYNMHTIKLAEMRETNADLTRHEQRIHTGVIGGNGKVLINTYDRPKLKQPYEKVIK